ncbi:MAG: cytochrome P450 [Solirubrobacteraceae bacterium]
MPTDVDLNFDHYDPQYAADPYPVLRELRATCPVAHSDKHEGFWLATKYELIRQLLLDTHTFSSRYSSVPKDIGFGDFMVPPLHLDPPEHTRSRKLLAGAFAPRSVERLLAPIRERVITVLSALEGQQEVDLSYDFARLVPTAVVCELVGCPDELDRFTGWVERLLEQAGTNIDDARQAALEMFTYISDIVSARREQPGDDIITMLCEAEVEGEKLDNGEIIFTAVLLVLAGIDTTWSTLATSILYLAQHPQEQQRLRENPELLRTAREEFLRMFSPVTIGRLIKEDTELAGQCLRKDEMVLLSIPSANRDEDIFPDAESVQLDREPNRHMAFGYGSHRCLGVNIARTELTVALEELLRQLPPFTLVDDEVDWTLGQVRGPKRVRVRFQS